MKSPLVIYHKHCVDGAGAALAAWLRFGEEAEYRAAQYGDPAPTDDEVRGRDVFVLDFHYSREETMRLYYAVNDTWANGRLVVLDHHISAQKELGDLSFCTFDMKRSGAVMSWEYFHYDPKTDNTPWHPELFAYIQDRDLFTRALPNTKEISAALVASGALKDFRALIQIYRHWHEDPIEEDGPNTVKCNLISDGRAILKAEAQMIDTTVALAEEVELSIEVGPEKRTIRGLAVTSSVLQTDIGDALAIESARRGRDAVGIIYCRDGNKKLWRVSMRSRDIFDPDLARPTITVSAPDVSIFAKHFGGGGHAKAAGFEVSVLPWSKEQFMLDTINNFCEGTYADVMYCETHEERNKANIQNDIMNRLQREIIDE